MDDVPTGTRGGVFVLPTSTVGQQGPVAGWVSTAGWASAAARVLGSSWIVTPHGIVDPVSARDRGSRPDLTSERSSTWRRRLPTVVKTAVKDVRARRRARTFRVPPAGPWAGHDLAFVWQRHELFHTAGLDLARELRVPSVLFVPAPLVWEARRWGVRRPGWERLAERVGERPSMQRADLVCAGTDAVAEQCVRIGADPDRVIVTPTGVDLEIFRAGGDGAAVRRRYGLDGRFVVGWVGSFRRFHALDLVLDAVERMPSTTLLLIGDGPERPAIEAEARRRSIAVVATGTVPHGQLPDHLAAMDAAVVVAAHGETFHYSPLKLAEYLAAGLPVVAPRVAQVAERLHDGIDAILVPPGDPGALAGALRALEGDPALRARLGEGARRAAEANWSWDGIVRLVDDRLGGSARPTERSRPR